MTKRDISSYSRDECVTLNHCHSVICNFTRDTNELIAESNPKENKLSDVLQIDKWIKWNQLRKSIKFELF